MMHMYTQVFRWLIVSVLLIITGGCNNPKVYFSTGTTVGLEATPPTTETPPHITFGYKRAEIALVPVQKLEEPQGKPSKGNSAPLRAQPTDFKGEGESDSQPTGETPGAHGPQQQSNQAQAKEVSGSDRPDGNRLRRGCSKGSTETQGQGAGSSARIKDAFSVLAAFHLAVNWFGPSKIEQHFATGCAAINLIKGITEEEEDKRNAEEARSELNRARRALELTERNVNRLSEDAATLETKAGSLKDKIEKEKMPVKEDEEKATVIGASALRLTEETDALKLIGLKDPRDADGILPLANAEVEAMAAIKRADKFSRNRELQQQAKQTKDDANQLIKKITDSKPSILKKINDTLETLKRVQRLIDQCRGKIKACNPMPVTE